MRISYQEIVAVLQDILVKKGVSQTYAESVATTMTTNSLLGTYTHGINRFSRLIQYIDSGAIDVAKEAERVAGLGGYEVWDGNAGLGIVNATKCTKHVIKLAESHGIGCVALRNTNHWMRGGTYGSMIAEAGMIGICITNTFNNTLAWGSGVGILGNNPIILAVPAPQGVVMADLAMSQFSYGKLELAKLEGKQLPYDGGFDLEGNITRDPQKIMDSKRIMPTGMWKGSAMTLLLDLITATLSQGQTVRQISAQGSEYGVSQTFIAINYRAIVSDTVTAEAISDTIEALLEAPPLKSDERVRYPGQAASSIQKENEELGIPVDESIWEGILAIQSGL